MGTTCSKNEEFSLFRPGALFLGRGKKVLYPFRSFGMLPCRWKSSAWMAKKSKKHQAEAGASAVHSKSESFFWGEGLLW